MNGEWKIVDTSKGAIIRPIVPPRCPFCKARMIMHAFVAQYYPVKNFYHADVNMKCLHCGWFTTFGIPLTKEEYERLKESPLNGVTLTKELLDIDEFGLFGDERKVIESAMKKMGYW